MTGSIEVVNKHTHKGDGIVIMRGTPLGNPFVMSDTNSREKVVLDYYKWLRQEFTKGDVVHKTLMDIVNRVQAGEQVKLICCCKPLLCHGDVIKTAVEAIIEFNIKKLDIVKKDAIVVVQEEKVETQPLTKGGQNDVE